MVTILVSVVKYKLEFYKVGINSFVVVGVGGLGTIVRSTDNGSSFSNVTSPNSNCLYGVGFGKKTFVGVGGLGIIVRSMDNG